MERCSSRWKCAASNLTVHFYTNPTMFTHTAADRAGFRCRHIESIFIVSGAARATQYLSDVGAWCENRGLRGDDLVVLLRGCRKFRVCEPYEEACKGRKGAMVKFGYVMGFRNPRELSKLADAGFYAAMFEQIEYLEQTGFDTVWTTEHH